MEYYFADDPIANKHTDEADIVMSYMDRGEDHGQGQFTFSRYVRANIVDDDDNGDAVIEITAIDNCNGGMFAMGDILMDAPGGEMIEHSDTIRVPTEEIDKRRADGAVDIRTLSDFVIQDIKEWSDNTSFKSSPNPVPEKFKLDL